MASRLFPEGSSDVLYIVDLSSYVLRAYHAVAPLHSSSGEPTWAIHGTVNMLELMLRERKPQLLAIALDSGRETFRKQIYPGYKANRPPAPDDLKSQLARCEAIVNAFHAACYKRDGVEADDLIATLVTRVRPLGLKVVIVAADKDLMQLVSDDVLLWDTMRNRVLGVPEVEERFGVGVAQVRDYLALTGDSSDNIPGVPSVGPKTASELLRQYGDLPNIYANVDKVSRKALQKALIENRDNAYLSRELVALKNDCDIDVSLEKLRYTGRDVPTLRRLYSELGFTRQLQQLDQESAPSAAEPAASQPSAAPQRAPEPAPVFDASKIDYQVLTSAEALGGFVAELRAGGRVAIEVVTTEPSSMRGVLIGLSLAGEDGTARYVPLRHRYVGAPQQLPLPKLVELLGPLLLDAAVVKSGHDLKHASVVLARENLPVRGFGFDAALASYLLDPESRHDRTALAQRELGLVFGSLEELQKPARGKRIPLDELEVERVGEWACRAADVSARLRPRLEDKLEGAGLVKLFRELELPLAEQLVDVELAGIRIDVERLADLGRQCDAELRLLEQEAHRVAGREFNVNSPRQLETLLFDELGLKPLRRTKTSRSTDADTLEALSESHELPRVVLEIRQVSKLKGTYIDALPALADPKTMRVHSSWEQAVAATGRLSSTDPNLQNIPIRTELGRKIRGAFVASPGHFLVSADYSQIELRVLAHLSQDEVLCDAFRSGQDVHLRTSMEIFEVGATDVTREMRTRAKAVNFGVIYGQGDSGLSKVLGIPRAEAASFIAAYFRRYQGVRKFMNETLERARSGEAVRSLLGRHRLLPNIRSANRSERLAAERIAMNMPIQGTAADILKLAMLALRKPPTPGSRMVLTVHDELVFEVPESECEAAKAAIKHTMENVYPLSVPLEVDVGHGRDWNSAH